METAVYSISGGDYEGGGSASRQLKELLKKIGADPKAIRKTMVAAYETEMNTVIHARQGTMKVAVDPVQVDVVVADEGPGIPDIDLAMREGYSTAPAKAREMGFGAGMGLPNIRKNADRFSLQSVAGEGTQVRFTVFLRSQETAGSARNSVRVTAEACQACLQCLRACPTQALRVYKGKPCILGHLCVDCTSCIAVCGPKALAVPGLEQVPAPSDETVLVLPASFLAQFQADGGPSRALDALRSRGFRRVRLSSEWEDAVRAASLDYARNDAETFPVLAPVCPAVVSLIQLRYPSLLGHVAPFLTPMEAAREELTAPHVVFAAACPSQFTLLNMPAILTQFDIVSASVMYNVVRQYNVRCADPNPTTIAHTSSYSGHDVFEVSGMFHVMKVLEEIENGHLDEHGVIELYACTQGCFGSPVWPEDPFVARERYVRMREHISCSAGDHRTKAGPGFVRRTQPLQGRAGVRLDQDMGEAIRKLARIDTLTKGLPGRNCSVCGAPTCAALAEDVVLGRATLDACVYREEKR